MEKLKTTKRNKQRKWRRRTNKDIEKSCLHEPWKKGDEIQAEEQMTSKAKEKAKGKERAGEGGTGE